MFAHISQRLEITQKRLPENGEYYHYSSNTGFLAMVEYRKLWFTDSRFLNDSQEYEHGLSVLQEVLNEYEALPFALPIINEQLLQKAPIVYTFSLTTKPDLLSQWRGYCPDGGHCLGLNTNQLNELLNGQSVFAGPCKYERQAQKDFIKSFLLYTPDEIRDLYARHAPDMMRREADFSRSVIDNLDLLLFLKHPSFLDEAEWRIIKRGVPVSQLKFRTGKSTLIPYVEVTTPKPAVEQPTAELPSNESATTDTPAVVAANELPSSPPSTDELCACKQKSKEEQTMPLLLDKLIVSYGPNQTLSVIAAKQVVERFESCSPTEVYASTIPYRYW